jgi:hypothetical protein
MVADIHPSSHYVQAEASYTVKFAFALSDTSCVAIVMSGGMALVDGHLETGRMF